MDNQLRGRAGRQGDPGSSQFFLSLEDDLMRIFMGDRLKGMMERLGMEDDVPIESRMVTKSIQNAQKRVEGHNFDIRKNLIEYDDVMNLQRKTVYGLRRQILGDDPMEEEMLDLVERVVLYVCETSCPPKMAPDTWDLKGVEQKIKGLFAVQIQIPDTIARFDDLTMFVFEKVEARWKKRQKELGQDFVVVDESLIPKDQLPATAKVQEPVWRFLLRQLYLRQIDRHWQDHLTQMDHLRDGIGLRGYGNRDPKIEYKREGHQLFISMMREVDHNTAAELFHLQLMSAEEVVREEQRQRQAAAALQRAARLQGGADQNNADAVASTDKNAQAKAPRKRPGRNDPCWCGSGKKYKKCHMKEDAERDRAARVTV